MLPMLQFTLPLGVRNPLDVIRDTRGSITVTFAMLLIPMMLIVGLAVDYTRMIQFKAALQNAVDEAAISGAAVFSSASTASTAQTVATNYFNESLLPSSLARNAPTVTTNTGGTINPALGTAGAYTVTVSASATVSTTLLSLLLPSVTINATGTAGSPVVTAAASFQNISSSACDRNAVYLYQVPAKSGGGYDYSSVPSFSTGASGNYYFIGSSDSTVSAPSNNTLPNMTANQPLGIALSNTTNGNQSNNGCGVTGANSYGAPDGAQQWFYSSLVANGQSPSENTNYQYKVVVTSVSSILGGSSTITAASGSQQLSNGTWQSLGSFTVPSGSSASYNNLYTYLGVNAGSNSNCTSTATSSIFLLTKTTVTTYTCTTQYFTTATSSQSNCSLYVQGNITNGQLSTLSTSSAPSAALGNCFNPANQSAANFAPSCAQISAMKTGSGNSDIAPALAFWWDDAGGVGQNEQYYGPSAHCSAASSGGPGYGEDCQYKNNSFAMQCSVSGGSGSGYTMVVLTQ